MMHLQQMLCLIDVKGSYSYFIKCTLPCVLSPCVLPSPPPLAFGVGEAETQGGKLRKVTEDEQTEASRGAVTLHRSCWQLKVT